MINRGVHSPIRATEGLIPKANNPFYLLAAPHIITWCYFLPIFFVYLVTNEATFRAWWGVPKLLSHATGYGLYFLSLLMLFGITGFVGSRLPVRIAVGGGASRSLPMWFLRACFLIALLAYGVWFGVGLLRSGGLSNLISAYLLNPFYVKRQLLATISGVTTLTQVAVAAVPLLVCFKDLRKVDRAIIAIVVVLAITRAFLYSERLAAIEIIVPLAFLWLSSRRMTWSTTLRYIVIGVLSVGIFFTLNESRRSFVYRGITRPADIAYAGTQGFLGYYMTSVNNALLLMERHALETPLFNTFQTVWRFPQLDISYPDIMGVDSIWMPDVLARDRMNPDFNTPTAIGTWVLDYGNLGVPMLVAVFGIISGLLYRHATRGRFSAALYSVWLVGLLEFMRIDYFTNVRLFPAYLMFAGALFLISIPSGRRIRATGR